LTKGNNSMSEEAYAKLIQKWEAIPNVGIIRAFGDTVPVDGRAGYAPGCTFQHTDASGEEVFYVNVGTALSCNFDAYEIGLEAALEAVGGAAKVGIADSGSLITGTTVEAAIAELAAERAGSDTIAATGACTAAQFMRGCVLATCAAATDITLPATGVPIGAQCTFIKTAGSTAELKLSATALIGPGSTSNEATGADAIGDSYTVTCIANDSYVITAQNIAA
jgi:hypothetical protein